METKLTSEDEPKDEPLLLKGFVPGVPVIEAPLVLELFASEEYCDTCGHVSSFEFDGASCNAGRFRCLTCWKEPTPVSLITRKDCKKCAGVNSIRVVPGHTTKCLDCGKRYFTFTNLADKMKIFLFWGGALLVVSFVIASLIWGSIPVSAWLWDLFTT